MSISKGSCAFLRIISASTRSPWRKSSKTMSTKTKKVNRHHLRAMLFILLVLPIKALALTYDISWTAVSNYYGGGVQEDFFGSARISLFDPGEWYDASHTSSEYRAVHDLSSTSINTWEWSLRNATGDLLLEQSNEDTRCSRRCEIRLEDGFLYEYDKIVIDLPGISLDYETAYDIFSGAIDPPTLPTYTGFSEPGSLAYLFDSHTALELVRLDIELVPLSEVPIPASAILIMLPLATLIFCRRHMRHSRRKRV